MTKETKLLIKVLEWLEDGVNTPPIGLRGAIKEALATPPLPVQPQRQPLTDELYNELLFAVGNKYPNETRHQTALRYIQDAETCGAQLAKAHNIGAK